MNRSVASAALVAALTLSLSSRVPAQGPTASSPVSFSEVTTAAGITFRHVSGAFGRKYLPETMGSGGAFADLDGDGWQDIVFINSTTWPGRPPARSLPAVYRNNRDGTFTDVTRQAGLTEQFYGMGVSAADYDNDGDLDLYVTALGPNRLFRNDGNWRFTDVTAHAGVGDPGFSTSAAWFDADADGKLDLYVANYVQWSIDKDLFCTLDGQAKTYCTPESYKGQSGTFYRNRGDGTFEDATRKAGLLDPNAKALGVALIDEDGDGRLDLFVANDTQPNRLYRNKGDGTFVDVAVPSGVAFNEAGVARAGMGVDAGDYDGSGRQSLIVGNFANEMMALYNNEGTGLFIDEAPRSTLGRATLLSLTFGCFFFDVDLDGRLDVFSANGHVADDIERVQPKVKYAQPAHLFRNLGERRFADQSAQAGPALARPVVGRGAAYGDYDNDGDLDILMTVNNGPARLLRNDGGNRNGFLRVALVGTTSNRDGIGAKVTIEVPGRKPFASLVKTGSSYLSQSELPVTFGLGNASAVTAVIVTWPTGKVERVSVPAVNRLLVVREGSGVVKTEALRPASPRANRSPGTPER